MTGVDVVCFLFAAVCVISTELTNRRLSHENEALSARNKYLGDMLIKVQYLLVADGKRPPVTNPKKLELALSGSDCDWNKNVDC